MRAILTTEIFDAWFAGLRDARAKARINARIRRAEEGNLGDCGPGYRLYFIQRGLELVILLAGGDKSTQSKDIKQALEIAKQV